MSQMDPGETEYEPAEYIGQAQDQRQDTQVYTSNEQSGRTFFAYLSFFIALILLATFLNTPLDGLIKLLVLFGMIIFGMLGMLLLEKRHSLTNLFAPASPDQDTTDEDEQDVETMSAEAEPEEDGTDTFTTLTPFELLIQQALDSIPDEFHEQMDNLVVLVENEPDAETLERIGTEEGHILLGLYQGTPLTAQGHSRALLPERITIYQHNIEQYCHGDPARIREQVRQTLLHEIAHHFGMDHEEMPIWIK
jgi:predicted Zn-dependent protease with MMP-like domain